MIVEIPERLMTARDVPEACRILNNIIQTGGTTAFEVEVSEAEFLRMYQHEEDLIACHVALDADGQVAGFQWIGRKVGLPHDCADIATFSRRDPPLRGTGRVLFSASRDFAQRSGFRRINATIRADNVPGLGYYVGIGFTNHSVASAVPLRDGTPVDRISKRYNLV